MRRTLSLLLTLLLLIPMLCVGVSAAGGVIGTVLNTDIVAYINGYAIPSYNLFGNTIIVAEELLNYGFNVVWDGSARALYIEREPERSFTASYIPSPNTAPIGSPAMEVYSTDIRTYIGGIEVDSFNVGGLTVIPMDSLAALCAENYVWDGSARALYLTLADGTVEKPLESWERELLAEVDSAVAAHRTQLTVNVPTRDYEYVNELLSGYMNNPTTWTAVVWVSQLSVVGERISMTVELEYTASTSVIARVNERVDALISEARALGSDYLAVEYIHDKICEMTVYDDDYYLTMNNSDAYLEPRYHTHGVILNGKAVCQGYAETMEYILNRMGIPCSTIRGYTDETPHAWNAVYLDGEGYLIDATWDDTDSGIIHKYFMRTSAEMAATHVPDPGYELPAFTAVKYDWFRQNGRYFESGNTAPIIPLVREAIASRSMLELKFSTPAEAARFRKAMLTDGEVFTLVRQAGFENQTVWSLWEDGSEYFTFLFDLLK